MEKALSIYEYAAREKMKIEMKNGRITCRQFNKIYVVASYLVMTNGSHFRILVTHYGTVKVNLWT